MADDARQKITKRVVDAASPREERYTIWDTVVPGFGLRVSPTGRKVFILRYRPKNSNAKRFMTLGLYGPTTPDQARDRALKVLGDVASGQDPARVKPKAAGASVSELIQLFLEGHVAIKRKKATYAAYENALRKVERSLGRKPAAEVERQDIARLHAGLNETPYIANYVIAAVSSMYAWAGEHGEVPEGFNPARRIAKFRESRRERYLTFEEMKRLGDTLRLAETDGLPFEVDETSANSKHAPKPENRRTVVSASAVAAIRLLLFTGCRLREILHLRWAEVDLERAILILPESKTGRRTILLGSPAVEVLRGLPKVSSFVFPGEDLGKPRSDLKRPWSAIRRHAGLEGVRIHDLRHSFASVGAGSGHSLPIIGKLLGHTQSSTTQRYAHLADDPLRAASEAIALKIALGLS